MKKLLIGAAIIFVTTYAGTYIVALSIKRSPQAATTPYRQPTPTPTPARLTLDPSYYRLELETNYLQMINEVNNNYYNHVTTKLTKSKSGYTLYAYHSFFGQYEFQIGNFGKEVSAWITRNYSKLKLAKITRVGVHGTGPYASYTYYEVQ
jgi:hypothetical protein